MLLFFLVARQAAPRLRACKTMRSNLFRSDFFRLPLIRRSPSHGKIEIARGGSCWPRSVITDVWCMAKVMLVGLIGNDRRRSLGLQGCDLTLMPLLLRQSGGEPFYLLNQIGLLAFALGHPLLERCYLVVARPVCLRIGPLLSLVTGQSGHTAVQARAGS